MAQAYDFISKIVSLGDSGSGKSSLTIRLCEGRFVSHHDVTIGVEFGSRIVPVGPPASLEHNINNPTTTSHSSSTTATSVTQPPNNANSSSSAKATAAKEPVQKHMKLSLWDTAGQETYKSITRSYFRGASGALLVFDITRRSTFASVTAWLHDLRQIAEDDIVVILVGNKSDLAGGASPNTGGGGDDAATATVTTTSTTTVAATPNRRQVTRQEAEQWCKENKVMQYVETSAKSGENVEQAFLEVAERIYQNIEAGKYDLNDRRSGVKGPGAGGGGASRTVKVVGPDRNAAKKAGGGCC